tara:strand:+ start:1436 stop:2287 length:852 start_codon:yes stop_codon:yes gene_type:complete
MTDTIKTFGEAAEWTYQKHWKRQRSVRTVVPRLEKVKHHIGHSFPLGKLGKLSKWLDLQADLQEEDQCSNATVNRAISVATTAIKKTFEAQLHSVKCPSVPRLEETKCRFVYFTKDQVKKLAHYAEDIYDRQDLSDAIIFSAYTGVRQGELLKLRPDDIDFNLNVIWIGGKPKQVTKSNNVRTIQIHPIIEPILKRRLDNRRLFGDDWTNKDQLYNAFKKVRKYAGISDEYVWHCLRHSFATYLAEVTHPRQVMELLGHANIETTLRYCKPTQEACNKAVLSI